MDEDDGEEEKEEQQEAKEQAENEQEKEPVKHALQDTNRWLPCLFKKKELPNQKNPNTWGLEP